MNDQLTRSLRIVLFAMALVATLYFAKPFLAPLAFAALFSMLLLPASLKFESWGMSRGFAVATTVIIFFLVIAGIIALLVWQVSDFAGDTSGIQKNFNDKITKLKDYVSSHFGVTRQKQEEIISNQQSTGTGGIGTIVMALGGFLTDALLTLVYIFLFLYYRSHLKAFVMLLVPSPKKREADKVIEESSSVAQQYLSGMGWMILSLFVMYSIGFTIVGVNSSVLFAALCSLFEIVPFVGNLTGNILTVMAVLVQGGSVNMIIGVLVTYATVQFLQTYLLEPLVVGKGVRINPLFTISGIVAGELIWGIPGMILAIPALGVTKIICDHIESLKPIGFLIGEEKKPKASLLRKRRA